MLKLIGITILLALVASNIYAVFAVKKLQKEKEAFVSWQIQATQQVNLLINNFSVIGDAFNQLNSRVTNLEK